VTFWHDLDFLTALLFGAFDHQLTPRLKQAEVQRYCNTTILHFTVLNQQTLTQPYALPATAGKPVLPQTRFTITLDPSIERLTVGPS